MPNGDRPTKKQHYIPQVYLRGFSLEYEKRNKDHPNDKYTIYRYDLNNIKQVPKAVPIKSICYKKNLYEVTGHEGEIVLSNYLENFFSDIEKTFSDFRNKLERKAFLEENYRTKCFLTKEEKGFWITFILTQMLRIPQILDMAESVVKETLGDNISTNQAKNIARVYCLPFFKEIEKDSEEAQVFEALLEPMKDMSFGIGVDKNRKLITSDKTVFVYTKEMEIPCSEYEKVIFPITSELCLFLYGGENKTNCPNNFLFTIDDETREEIFKSMTSSSFGKLYSNHILDKTEWRYVKEVMKEKETDKGIHGCSMMLYKYE